MTATETTQRFLEAVRDAIVAADVLDDVEITDGMVRGKARDAAEEAWYRVEPDGDTWWVSLVTADRWLSESIESDLMHTGDPLEELIEEELVELGADVSCPPVKHYRSEDMLYTFRSPLPASPEAADAPAIATTWVRAYEAAFRELGDMA